jgi:voltage-gated potassium channel|tara:strand:- start:189 stop:464 length:276 start_codon:yes stop_codon:yes gene_type:complete
MIVPFSVLIITILYGLLYAMMKPEEFGFTALIDPFYFSFTTMSSVGYGDFSPKTNRAKAVVMSQQALLLVEIAALVGLLITTNKVNNMKLI